MVEVFLSITSHAELEEPRGTRIPPETVTAVTTVTLKLLSDVSKSSYLVDAEKNAGISFLERNQLQCDGSGLKFTFKNHDITVKIPEGTLAIGEKIHVEVAVMPMYGPFQFLKGARLISPVVWLCPLEKNVHAPKATDPRHSSSHFKWTHRGKSSVLSSPV